MKTDIEIARETPLLPIAEIAGKLGIPADKIEPYGRYTAKVPESLIDDNKVKQHKLILVTAITPTKAGIGKTTVSVGLALGMNRIGKKTIVALREPSLGPCFGMKGGAAGGGYAQVLPMDKINLHFTGDFHAVTTAHNMIAALLDNYIYQHREEGFAMKEVLWKRVLDVNDRNLRYIVTGLGAKTNGVTMESGFDITPASEIMAILCLAKDLKDLRRRIENILLGTTIEGKPFRVKDLHFTQILCKQRSRRLPLCMEVRSLTLHTVAIVLLPLVWHLPLAIMSSRRLALELTLELRSSSTSSAERTNFSRL